MAALIDPGIFCSTQPDEINASSAITIMSYVTGTQTMPDPSSIQVTVNLGAMNLGNAIFTLPDLFWSMVQSSPTTNKITGNVKVDNINVAGHNVLVYVPATQGIYRTTTDLNGDYEIDLPGSHVAYLITYKYIAESWQPNTYYQRGTVICPKTANGYYYSALSSGTSGPTEPSWSGSSSVVDSSVAWRFMGTLISPAAQGPLTPDPI